jgi:hypothetical protein
VGLADQALPDERGQIGKQDEIWFEKLVQASDDEGHGKALLLEEPQNFQEVVEDGAIAVQMPDWAVKVDSEMRTD